MFRTFSNIKPWSTSYTNIVQQYEHARERPNRVRSGTYRVRSNTDEEQDGNRSDHKHLPRVVQHGEEGGVREVDGDRYEAGPAL